MVDEPSTFCVDCWSELEWLGNSGCQHCGLPLSGTEIETCGRCLANPPRIDRIRSAVAYDDISRSIALQLKYGRKVGLAKTMARYMALLSKVADNETIVVPVPLHRWRLWSRGFNQSVLIAREMAKAWRLPLELDAIRRTKATRPLKGLSQTQRRQMVSGAFRVSDPDLVRGRSIILVDDVFTTGSTAEACALALRNAGARRVELFCWARVVRPSQIMR